MTHRSPDSRTGIFPGSFNPFTLGHLSIVERALPLFDRLVIAVGVNANKATDPRELEARLEAIRRATSGMPGVEVASYSGLTVDFARETGASFIVRGVRSVADFEYERQIADVNRTLTGIETVLLLATPELASVSSSIVRELQAYGCDVTKFLP
ncbi:MAG: pantetheine-phosphate adenylyltransferase [Muribaculaceae bacterium]|nr:pantetheine-phosphate adenylyltransferase [Muribaculaceae bacterium]